MYQLIDSDQPTIFKLINGEDIIVSDFVIIDNKHIIVSNPYAIQKTFTQNGYTSIYLFKWMSYGEDNSFPIDISMVLTYNTPNIKLQEYYIQCLKEEIINESNGQIAENSTSYH